MPEQNGGLFLKGGIVLSSHSDWDEYWIRNVYVANKDFDIYEMENEYWTSHPKRRKVEGFFSWLVELGLISEVNYIDIGD